MAWVAFDRAGRFHDEFGRQGLVERWRALRDEIRTQVLEQAWSNEKQAFAQSFGSDELDASVLLMPLVEFLPANDEPVVKSVEAIRRELTVDNHDPLSRGPAIAYSHDAKRGLRIARRQGAATPAIVTCPVALSVASCVKERGRLASRPRILHELLTASNRSSGSGFSLPGSEWPFQAAL